MCVDFGRGGEISSYIINRETCSCILYIATNCNIVVFMTVCIYRYIHTTALYYWFLKMDAAQSSHLVRRLR